MKKPSCERVLAFGSRECLTSADFFGNEDEKTRRGGGGAAWGWGPCGRLLG